MQFAMKHPSNAVGLIGRPVLLSALLCWAGVTFAVQTRAPASPGAPNITAEENRAFEKAMALLNSGDTASAESLLRQLHERLPDNFEINESLGLLYAGEDKLAEATPLLRAAAAENAGSDVAHANLGTAYLKEGHAADAARELARAADLNPANAHTQEALGQTWMLLKQPAKAATAFEAALAQDASNSSLLYNAALARFDSGKAADAEHILARMNDAASSPEAQSLYGDIEEHLGHFEEAAKHYDNAAHLDPSEPNIYALGIEFLRHWTFDTAEKEFAAGVRLFPQSQRMRMGLGVAHYGAAHYDEAIPIFADLLVEHPGNPMYAELLGRTCAVLTEGLQPKCSSLIQYAEAHPKDAILATYAATSILHQSADDARMEEAQRLLGSAIRANPNLPEARYGMGLLLQTESRWQQSVPELETAIRLRPAYASAHYRLALAYSHLGQRDKAQAEIALQLKYKKQEQDGVDARMKQVTTFLVKMQ